MSRWKVLFSKEANEDFLNLDGHQKLIVTKAINKISINPLPRTKGGYGIPLGNKHGFNLTNLNEIKLRGQNLRIIYELYEDELIMRNIMIGKRSDFEVYSETYKRIKKQHYILGSYVKPSPLTSFVSLIITNALGSCFSIISLIDEY